MARVPTKVIFLGPSGIGKTVLIHRIASNSFADSVSSTVASSFVAIDAKDATGDPVTLHIWDTAGQERFKALTQNYFRDSAVAVVCHGPDCAGLCDWPRLLREAEPDCHIFTVLTKTDLYSPAQAAQGLASARTLGTEFSAKAFSTSAMTGEGVEGLVQELANEAATIEAESSAVPLEPKTKDKPVKECC